MKDELARRRRVIESNRAVGEPRPGRAPVSAEVLASWERCRVSVPNDRAAVLVDDADSIADRWEASPIRLAAPELPGELEAICDANDMVAGVSDTSGRLMWSGGQRSMRRVAERVNFVKGGRWDEWSAGTNAIALALISERPSTVFSTEHWLPAVEDLVCYAAPVRDPAGELVGVIDITGHWGEAHPLGATTINALARVIEQSLATVPGLIAPVASVSLRVMGRPSLRLRGRGEVPVTLRQVEILKVLASLDGATLDELHAYVYGDRAVSMSTLKAEISRLRQLLDGGIASRPYRLTVDIDLDSRALLTALGMGDLDGAAALYRGPLLPRSEAPFVVERRHHIDVAFRTALLAGASAAATVPYLDAHPFDAEVIDHALGLAAPADPLAADLTARLAVATDL